MSFYNSSEGPTQELFPGAISRAFHGDKLHLLFSESAAGCVVTQHSHPAEQAGIILAGEITVTIGDETSLVKTGEIYFIPAGVEHSVQVGNQPARVVDVFGPENDG
jgi:quercetin dioxygenase-like cupin family protein